MVEFVVNTVSEVIFQAGQNITLSEGFHASSAFTARIADCVTTTNINTKAVEKRSAPSVAALKIQVQPNPALDFVTVTYELQETSPVQISILDLQSSIVQQIQQNIQLAGKYQVDLMLNNLEAGICLLIVQTSSETITKKIMVNP